MLSAEQLLEQAAKDGSMVPEEWPRALRFIIPRLEDIVHNDFPIPTVPAPQPTPARDHSSTPSKTEDTGESIATGKVDAPPGGASDEGNGSQKPDSDAQETAATLPPELQELYTSIVINLNKNFPQYPPHTLQRLAELVVSPRAHYRFLPPYLRALDRVVTVSSPTTIFPLPQTSVPSSGATILNGVTPGSANMSSPSLGSPPNPGSDDNLGGALLTPIPWLRPENDRSGNSGSELVSESTEMVDGPNGAGRIETVSVVNGVLGTTTSAPTSTSATSSPTETDSDTPSSTSGTSTASATATAPDALRDTGPITQGELLRQEQEAGIVTIPTSGAPGTSSRPTTRSSGILSSSQQHQDQQSEPHIEGEPLEEAEAPHARGPDIIGMEDMGPQQGGGLARGIDMEAAVGRPAPHPEKSGEEAHENEGSKEDEARESREEEMRDADDVAPSSAAEGSKETRQDETDAVTQPQQLPSSDTVEPDDDWEMLQREDDAELDGVADALAEAAAAKQKDKESEKDGKDDAQAEPVAEAVAEAEKEKESHPSATQDKKKSESSSGGGNDATKEKGSDEDTAEGKAAGGNGKKADGKEADEDERMGGCDVA